jgi:uncharacterized protein involved in response to NO
VSALPLYGDGPAPARGAPGLALARKGFRPFFVLASAFASVIVPLWLLVVGGVLRPGAYLEPPIWHAHEMVFGFAIAVVAGFLLTAVGNWTQRETLVGAPLLALALLWVAGRVAMLAPALLPRFVPGAVDLAFLPALLVVLARSLVVARNRRDFVMLGVLAVLFVANGALHLSALGLLPAGAQRRAILVSLDVVVLLVLLMAGRVFPMFTSNATGVTTIRSSRWLDALTVAGMAIVTLLGAVDHDGRAATTGAGLVGVLAACRAARWGARYTARVPLLWILHAGYGWVCVGLLLRALAGFWPAIPASSATHALTVGALGSLTLGMMARVALGHTGRPLVAPAAAVWAFGLVTGAALVRVVVPLLAPAAYFTSLAVAAILWTAAFAAFLVAYAPVLWRPRIDGRPG